MDISRRMILTLPISLFNSDKPINPIKPLVQNVQVTRVVFPQKPTTKFITSENTEITIPEMKNLEIQVPLEPNKKEVVISDINDIKFFNHCATIFELYHDEYNTFNQYKKDKYIEYRLSLLEAFDRSTSMVESKGLRDFLIEQGSSFNNVSNIFEI